MSPVSSTVIQDIEVVCNAGNASMAYFYFDFRDANKQSLRDLVSSLLTQLSACSRPCCDILSELYWTHNHGSNQPSNGVLAECLKQMLLLPDQRPIYFIIDGIDESPNSSGIPSHRKTVLELLEELVNLSLPNLHICVTSRPKIDIRNVLEPLTSRRVSLHDQSGQRKDITDYVRSVVYSRLEQIMRRWRTEIKNLVVKTLSDRADGRYVNCFIFGILVESFNRFRWVICQLEILRQCLSPTVQRTLDELPETLDETYERILKEIGKPIRDHARRLLQCLVVAIRPISATELAGVLAVDLDDAEGITKSKSDWRWEDEEQALITSCSNLITVVETDDSRFMQLSHISVKDFLTSERLATSSDVSRYHVDLKPAHTILAQACLSSLLRPDDHVEENVVRNSPSLTESYAARHWITHAHFKGVSLYLPAMEYLFDLDKPYFAAWPQLYDIDTPPSQWSSSLGSFAVPTKSSVTPLYYAVLCGFQDLTERLVAKYPQQVNASGGYYVTPLFAALAEGSFQTVNLLRHNGAHVNVRGCNGRTPLHSAARHGDLNMVQLLLDYKADVNAQDNDNWTPIHYVSEGPALFASPHSIRQLLSDITQLLLWHGAAINVRSNDRSTPLHIAANHGWVEVVRVLLEHGADVDAEDNRLRTPLHEAADYGSAEIVRVLLEDGAKVGAADDTGRTALHEAVDYGRAEADYGRVEVVRVLLEHGANIGAEDNEGTTPLHLAADCGKTEFKRVGAVRMLLEQGADVDAKDKKGRTPLLAAGGHDSVEVVRVLLEHGANVGVKDIEGNTPLHEAAANFGRVNVVRVLLEHGPNAGVEDNDGRTPLHAAAAGYRTAEVIRMLLEHGGNADAADDRGRTPLHEAADYRRVEAVRVLLEHGANVGAEDKKGRTPLHEAADYGRVEIEVVRLLLEHGANVDAEDNRGRTPFQFALANGYDEIMKALSKHGAKGVM